MTTQSKPLVPSKALETVQTAQYTVDALRASIDKATATNTAAGALTVSVNLVPAGHAADASNLIAKDVSIAPGACYGFPELVGHVLATGDSISAIASGVGVVFRVSGRETTT
jgi:hypothetical protein